MSMGTSIHEAAHAVTGVKLGLRVYDVYVYPDGSGQTSFGKVSLRQGTSARVFAMVVLAGPVAELTYMGRPVTKDEITALEGASSDVAKAGALAQQFDLHGVLEETTTLVKLHMGAITKVAEKLKSEGSVSEHELGGMI